MRKISFACRAKGIVEPEHHTHALLPVGHKQQQDKISNFLKPLRGILQASSQQKPICHRLAWVCNPNLREAPGARP